MRNRIRVDLERQLGTIDRNLFGGFAEHLGRCIYGGIYDPGSPLADAQGFRADVIAALSRLRMPLIRYPGGNFVSGYRWRDGIGPAADRPARLDLAWHSVESNQFGTDEFVRFCREVGSAPFLVVNCGDGDMREARDWVEYCNGTQDTALVQQRCRNGAEAPHGVKYWGIGNEVDGHWQIGYKTPQEYARAFTEFGKVMKWVDPGISLIASVMSGWTSDLVERVSALFEQAPDLVDYVSIHWYVGNREGDFAAYMALSELLEERLSACEGLIRGVSFARGITRQIPIAVDEWNVWYRSGGGLALEETYNLEDALMVAIQMNAMIRHCRSVRMANLAQIVNVIAPVVTRPDGLLLQTIFYPFELYSQHCGNVALDVSWEGETFAGGGHTGVRVLDVVATLNAEQQQLALLVVNRSPDHPIESEISLAEGAVSGPAQAFIVNGPDVSTINTFSEPRQVVTREVPVQASGSRWTYAFEPHSVTVLVCPLG